MTDSPSIDGGGNQSRAAKAELLSFATRLERLKAEKAASASEFSDQIKEVRAECKARGYDTKALNAVLRLRAMNAEDLEVVKFYADVLDVML